jgi:hypothetical protein
VTRSAGGIAQGGARSENVTEYGDAFSLAARFRALGIARESDQFD